MSVAELKEEASRLFAEKIEATQDEELLSKILEFLNGLQVTDDAPLNLSEHYDSIKNEYGSVLKKLAQ